MLNRSSRIASVILLTLLPWAAVCYGMYGLHSIIGTFFLYHGLCLTPAIIAFRKLWLPDFRRPTGKQALAVVAASLIFCTMGLLTYQLTGSTVVSKTDVMASLSGRGYSPEWLLPLSLYLVLVNATLEELFWRGVILNELDRLVDNKKIVEIWTAISFASWHYLVMKALVQPGYAEIVVLGVLLVGSLCSWLYRKTQSIVVPILWHAFVFDLAIMLVFIAISSNPK